MEEIEQWLPRLHGLVVGPGLGREAALLRTAQARGESSLLCGRPLEKRAQADVQRLHSFTESMYSVF